MVITVEEFLQKEDKHIDLLEREMTSSSWDANITGKDEDYEKATNAQKKITQYFNSKDRFEQIKAFLEQEQDPLVKRQLEVLKDSYLSSQTDLDLLDKQIGISNEIEQSFNSFRAKIKDRVVTDNEIKNILKESIDSNEVSEAWHASKLQGEMVSEKVIELAKLRNEIAKNLGFENYCDFSLSVGEQSEKEISRIFKELEELTREPFKKLKAEMDSNLAAKFNLDVKDLKPWHYGDSFFQHGPKMFNVNLDKIYERADILEIAKKFYKNIGLEVGDILAKSDLYEKPGKNQHAFCTTLNREGDVRILENLVNNEDWASTTLHELGHAVYEKYTARNLPFLLRTNAHTFVTEAVAMSLERLTKDTSFIKEYTGSELTQKEMSNLAMQEKQRQLVFARWAMTVYGFEKELYSNPDQDLNKKWSELVKKYQMIDAPGDKPIWASKIHIPCYPMYYHNYLLGELLASQIHAKARKISPEKGLTDPTTGHFLINKIFSKGASLRWDKLIEESFGEGLSPKYFTEELNR